MLVLTRKKEQSIVINDNIEVTIVDIQETRSGLASAHQGTYQYIEKRSTLKYKRKTAGQHKQEH